MDPVIKEFSLVGTAGVGQMPCSAVGWFQPVQIAVGVDGMNLLACPGEEPTTAWKLDWPEVAPGEHH